MVREPPEGFHRKHVMGYNLALTLGFSASGWDSEAIEVV
jgi:hypothetical protein